MCDPRWLAAATEGEVEPDAGSGAAPEARVERSGGAGRGPLLFVDDTLAEHLDEEMRTAPNVVRFLFTRARPTQAAVCP